MLNVLTVVSLALCVAARVVRVRSYWALDMVGWGKVRDGTDGEKLSALAVGWSRGRFAVTHTNDLPAGWLRDYIGPYYRREAGTEARGRRCLPRDVCPRRERWPTLNGQESEVRAQG